MTASSPYDDTDWLRHCAAELAKLRARTEPLDPKCGFCGEMFENDAEDECRYCGASRKMNPE